MQEKINTIREKCIKANRDIVGNCPENVKNPIPVRPIRLADVLLAIGKVWNTNRYAISYAKMLGVLEIAEFDIDEKQIGTCSWNLLKDDVTLQSEETIDFLYQLLSGE